jgi:hypothetical protein
LAEARAARAVFDGGAWTAPASRYVLDGELTSVIGGDEIRAPDATCVPAVQAWLQTLVTERRTRWDPQHPCVGRIWSSAAQREK